MATHYVQTDASGGSDYDAPIQTIDGYFLGLAIKNARTAHQKHKLTPTAKADVWLMRNLLVCEQFGCLWKTDQEDRIIVLQSDGRSGDNAKKQTILDTIDGLKSNMREHDILWVYFSGHVDWKSSPDGWLVTEDAIDGQYPKKALSFRQFMQKIENLPAEVKVVFLDCCLPKFIFDFKAKNMAMICSTRPGRLAKQIGDHAHQLTPGPFAWALNQARIAEKLSHRHLSLATWVRRATNLFARRTQDLGIDQTMWRFIPPQLEHLNAGRFRPPTVILQNPHEASDHVPD